MSEEDTGREVATTGEAGVITEDMVAGEVEVMAAGEVEVLGGGETMVEGLVEQSTEVDKPHGEHIRITVALPDIEVTKIDETADRLATNSGRQPYLSGEKVRAEHPVIQILSLFN